MSVEHRPAGFWIRFAALFIDGLVLVPTFILLFVDLLWWKSFLVVVLVNVPGLLYKPFMEAYKGATLGKMACGIKVVGDDGGNISLGKAYLRSLPNLAALCVSLVGYALLFANPNFQEATTIMDLISLRQPEELNAASFAVQFFVLADCLIVGLNVEKRAIHDFLAGSWCIYGAAGEASDPIRSDQAFYCSNCDKEISQDATFCPHCGTQFEA